MNANNDETPNDYAAFIAIDWADQQHVFSLQVAGQTKKETGILALIPTHGTRPNIFPIGPV